VSSLPKTVTRQRHGCNLNPGSSAPESSTITTWLPSHPSSLYTQILTALPIKLQSCSSSSVENAETEVGWPRAETARSHACKRCHELDSGRGEKIKRKTTKRFGV